MNDGFYSDVRDVAKWSRVLQLCFDRKLDTVLYVGMVTERQPWTPLARPAAFSRPEVVSFFALERLQIKTEQDRCADRILGLPRFLADHYGITLRFSAILDKFTGTESNRSRYFAEAVRSLTELQGHRVLAVVDPDNGVGEASKPKRSVQVRREEICQLATALPAESALMLVQFDLRQEGWRTGGASAWLRGCLSPLDVFHDDPGLTHYVHLSNRTNADPRPTDLESRLVCH